MKARPGAVTVLAGAGAGADAGAGAGAFAASRGEHTGVAGADTLSGLAKY
jgi:hypothetical protein